MFKTGDKVEWVDRQSYRRRIGVVEVAWKNSQMLEVVDFQTGEPRLVPFARASLVHGYLHIETPQKERF